MNPRKSLHRFLDAILDTGMAPYKHRMEKFRIRLTNLIILMCTATSLFYVIYLINYQEEVNYVTEVFAANVLVGAVIFFIHARRYYLLSRVLALLQSLFIVYFACLVLGFRCEAHGIIVAVAASGVLLMKRIWHVVVVIVVIIVTFIFIWYYVENYGAWNPEYLLPYAPYINFSIGVLSMTALSATVAYTVLDYVKEIEATNNSLQASNQILTENNVRIQTQRDRLELFASVASHDLRTPMRTISSFLGLIDRRIVDQPENKQLKEYLKYATDGVKEMHEVVSSISDINKLTRDVSFEKTLVDLNVVVDGLKKKFNTDLYPDLLIQSENLPILRVNKSHFVGLFQNLIENAWKYNNSDTKEIKITATRDDEYFHLYFADNGIGIDAEFSKTIFEPFKKLHTKSSYAGSGMGLAICHRICEMYHGEIGVHPNPKGGSVFHIILPLEDIES